jgi:hypothetical protein
MILIRRFWSLHSDTEEAEHMDEMREIMEFYYRKGGKGLQVVSLPCGMEAQHTGKKRIFI